MTYAMRSTARWWLGQEGWKDDFNRGLAMARDADSISKAVVIVYTYYNAIGIGVIVITPSHNPPRFGGFKYDPPHGDQRTLM